MNSDALEQRETDLTLLRDEVALDKIMTDENYENRNRIAL